MHVHVNSHTHIHTPVFISRLFLFSSSFTFSLLSFFALDEKRISKGPRLSSSSIFLHLLLRCSRRTHNLRLSVCLSQYPSRQHVITHRPVMDTVPAVIILIFILIIVGATVVTSVTSPPSLSLSSPWFCVILDYIEKKFRNL